MIDPFSLAVIIGAGAAIAASSGGKRNSKSKKNLCSKGRRAYREERSKGKSHLRRLVLDDPSSRHLRFFSSNGGIWPTCVPAKRWHDPSTATAAERLAPQPGHENDGRPDVYVTLAKGIIEWKIRTKPNL